MSRTICRPRKIRKTLTPPPSPDEPIDPEVFRKDMIEAFGPPEELTTDQRLERERRDAECERREAELEAIRPVLVKVMTVAVASESAALEHALAAGKLITEVKALLAPGSEFRTWFYASCPGLNYRTANDYERVYKHVSANSGARHYRSIREALRDHKKDNPPKPRFKAERADVKSAKEESRKDFFDRQPKPDLPPVDKPTLGSMEDWLGPEPDPEDMVPLEEWVASGGKGEWHGRITLATDFTLTLDRDGLNVKHNVTVDGTARVTSFSEVTNDDLQLCKVCRNVAYSALRSMDVTGIKSLTPCSKGTPQERPKLESARIPVLGSKPEVVEALKIKEVRDFVHAVFVEIGRCYGRWDRLYRDLEVILSPPKRRTAPATVPGTPAKRVGRKATVG